MTERQRTGRAGEDIVADYLHARGYQLVARNARAGRLEIDIIAERGGVLIFCEVRTKKPGGFYTPAETVDYKKRTRLRKSALDWLRGQKSFARHQLRIDVAAVTLTDGVEPQIEYYENIELR